MPQKRPLISFDWAIKRLLRQKANYGILEGFLSELFGFDLTIQSIPESEANSENAFDKTNKIDILCETTSKELILIELQYNHEIDYFHRMLFGTSKLITDYANLGDSYDKIKKVYSINIVYFELGQGDDYIYYGKTEFKGVHKHDILQITNRQKELYKKADIHEIFPEYYIIKVNKFNDIAKDTLDEWIFYLKNDALPEHYKAKGLDKVDAQLMIDKMSKEDYLQYLAYMKEQSINLGTLKSAKIEGWDEGKEEGREEGIEEGKIQEKINGILKALKRGKLSIEEIAEDFEVSVDYVLEIKQNS